MTAVADDDDAAGAEGETGVEVGVIADGEAEVDAIADGSGFDAANARLLTVKRASYLPCRCLYPDEVLQLRGLKQ